MRGSKTVSIDGLKKLHALSTRYQYLIDLSSYDGFKNNYLGLTPINETPL
jgi:hypothetical protein